MTESPPGIPFHRATRYWFAAEELETLERAYRITSRIPILAARVIAEQLSKPDLEPGQAAALVGKATRLVSMVRRDLVRFLPPDTPPTRGDLEAQILADAMAPGVSIDERVRALDALVGLPKSDKAADRGNTPYDQNPKLIHPALHHVPCSQKRW